MCPRAARLPIWKRDGSHLLSDDEAVAQYFRPAGDPMGVVDPASAGVHGIGGLRVADASIVPTAPRTNLNIPVIGLAEKVAAAILAE